MPTRAQFGKCEFANRLRVVEVRHSFNKLVNEANIVIPTGNPAPKSRYLARKQWFWDPAAPKWAKMAPEEGKPGQSAPKSRYLAQKR